MHQLKYGVLDKTVLVIGCGGLGCNVVEYLARCLIKKIIIIDNDVFKPSNLNRQLYCNKRNLNKSKVEIAKQRVQEISETEVIAISDKFPTNKLYEHIEDIDVIVDCLDNVKSRLILEEFAQSINVPLVHGALSSTEGQVATIMPGDKTLSKMYNKELIKVPETLAYVPSLIASIQASEVVNVLNGRPTLRNSMLLIDAKNLTFNKVKL